MSNPRDPVFLARRVYRSRRLIDASRALPFVAVVLFLLPLLWATGNGTSSTAMGGIFIFVVWAILIAISAAMSGPLSKISEDPEDSPSTEDDRKGPS
ncbi:MAG: hypothetical protein AAF667_05840 [Pseudomonadota bacterium]